MEYGQANYDWERRMGYDAHLKAIGSAWLFIILSHTFFSFWFMNPVSLKHAPTVPAEYAWGEWMNALDLEISTDRKVLLASGTRRFQ